MTTEQLLENPFWNALGTEHSHLAISNGTARRYPAEMIPFGGIVSQDEAALQDLRDLLDNHESIFLMSRAEDGPLPRTRGLLKMAEFGGLQMVYRGPAQQEETPHDARIQRLGESDLPEILALKAIAFPGYFGPRAASLGTFYGVRNGETLVAMAGERLALPGIREISAVCTHPAYLGRGYAAALIRRLLTEHTRAGLRSMLHAAARNTRAVALYERLGFQASRHFQFRQLRRTEPESAK